MSGSGLIIFVAIFGVLWFVLIRPQRTKQQQQRQRLSSVAPGDEILTVGGIYGIVQELEEAEDGEDGDDLIVEIAEGIHVRVARRAVATVVKPDEDEDEDDAELDDEDGDIEALEAGTPALEAAPATEGGPGEPPDTEPTAPALPGQARPTPAPEHS